LYKFFAHKKPKSETHCAFFSGKISELKEVNLQMRRESRDSISLNPIHKKIRTFKPFSEKVHLHSNFFQEQFSVKTNIETLESTTKLKKHELNLE
jgi:hypothetical protein